VTTNHFDVDPSFLSVWAYLNRAAAVEHEAGRCVAITVGGMVPYWEEGHFGGIWLALVTFIRPSSQLT
jgi:hypothetical protein